MADKLLGNARSITQPQVNTAAAALGGTAGNETEHVRWVGASGVNAISAILRMLRLTTATGQDSMALELRRRVDSTNHGFLRLQYDRTQIGFDATGSWDFTSGHDILPVTTESQDIGSVSKEVDNIFLQNAATVSDQRRKNDLGEISGEQAIAFVNALEPKWFSYKDTVIPARTEYSESFEADEKTGKQKRKIERLDHPEKVIRHGRPHAGFMAQQFKQAMSAAGIEDFAGYAYLEKDDTHVLRLMEMIGVLTAAVKHLARIAELESRPPEIREVEKRVEVPVAAGVDEAAWPELNDRLSDWDGVGFPADDTPPMTVEDLIALMRADPAAADARIIGLSSKQRKLLTDSFKERMNELNNRRLRAVKLNDFDSAWLEDHQTLYHKLAETGDDR